MTPRCVRMVLVLLLALLPLGCASVAVPTPTPTPVPCGGTPLPFETVSRGDQLGADAEGEQLYREETVVEAVTDSARLDAVLHATTTQMVDDDRVLTSVEFDLSRQTLLLVVLYVGQWTFEPIRVVGVCQRADGLVLTALVDQGHLGRTVPAPAVAAHNYHVLVVENDALLLHGRTPVRLERMDGFLLHSGYVDLPEQ